MKIGMVGCGKLGLMVALTIESRGHEVRGYDIDPAVATRLKDRTLLFHEEHAEELLKNTKMQMVPLSELCAWADILFLAPQTPHAPQFEGITPLPEERADFDYLPLITCVVMVNECLVRPTTCVVVSTVLPGTIERAIEPLINENFKLVYQPLFIAMGTVYHDFLHPEFVLCGTKHDDAAAELRHFYETIFFPVYKPIWNTCDEMDNRVFRTDIRTAEGIKVFYNTFITAKTVLANIYGELAHKLGMNADDIYRAMSKATDRLISPKYLKAGMGDGGGCHPRDNIALSYVARRENLSFDIFEALMKAREKHTEWLADLCQQAAADSGLPIVILGMAFKPETNITTGSPSLLLYSILGRRDVPVHLSDYPDMFEKSVFFIGCQHKRYQTYAFPEGSVVIDPFRYIPYSSAYSVIRIGDSSKQREIEQIKIYRRCNLCGESVGTPLDPAGVGHVCSPVRSSA